MRNAELVDLAGMLSFAVESHDPSNAESTLQLVAVWETVNQAIARLVNTSNWPDLRRLQTGLNVSLGALGEYAKTPIESRTLAQGISSIDGLLEFASVLSVGVSIGAYAWDEIKTIMDPVYARIRALAPSLADLEDWASQQNDLVGGSEILCMLIQGI